MKEARLATVSPLALSCPEKAAATGDAGPRHHGGKCDMFTRIIGVLFILAALAAAGVELVQWIASGTYQPVTLGGLWYMVHRASLGAAQAGIQRYVAPWIWDPVIAWVLLQPTWVIMAPPGALLAWLGWSRKKRRRRSRRLRND